MKELILIPIFIGNLTITSYRSVVEQTDETPFITANNGFVHNNGVAVSRDLHVRYGGKWDYGNILVIEDVGFKVINDLMADKACILWSNRRCIKKRLIRKQIDVWVATLEEEQKFHKKFKGKKVKVWVIKIKEE